MKPKLKGRIACFFLSAAVVFALLAIPRISVSSASGLTTRTTSEPATTNFERLLKNKQYLILENALKASGGVSGPKVALVEGVLASRKNQIAKSISLLTPLFSGSAAKFAPEEERLGLSALADDYTKDFNYAEAADTQATLLRRVGPFLSKEERDDVEGNRSTLELLRRAPAETVNVPASFAVATQKNSAGMIEAPVSVADRTEPWILDSGAGISLLIRSRAQELGLQISAGTTPVVVFFGATVPCHMAVIPLLRIGGAEVRNVAVLVMEDKDYYIPQIHLQLEAFLGYPVLSVLGRITFYKDGRFGVTSANEASTGGGSEMFMEQFAPLVAAGDGGVKRLFLLDTGAANTFLTARYLLAHRAEFAHEKLSSVEQPDGKLPAYYARRVILTLGGVQVTLHDVAVLAKPRGRDVDYFYGNLGQDVLKQFRSYTIDFRSMRFTVQR